ncbi:unnamed protein product [Meloidogyne enterolobii]|uniref:Uncharacterized protein n=1 Tax=Meloidogyne enterolobii TaxID=390850 RepID=A0ACB0YZT7_MELEN
MIFSWLLFAPLAILFARFQRNPLKRLLGEQLWFQVHRFLNSVTILCTFLAIICIMSATGGKWDGPKMGISVILYVLFKKDFKLRSTGDKYTLLWERLLHFWHFLS